jgi:hypothetical protein
MEPEARARHEAMLDEMAAEENRYAAEKKDIERDARKAEHERDFNKKRDPYFEFAEGYPKTRYQLSWPQLQSSRHLTLSLISLLCGCRARRVSVF